MATNWTLIPKPEGYGEAPRIWSLPEPNGGIDTYDRVLVGIGIHRGSRWEPWTLVDKPSSTWTLVDKP